MSKKKIPGIKIDARFADTMYTVEADSFALHILWRDHSKEYADSDGMGGRWGVMKNEKQVWKQDIQGLMYQVGTLAKFPVNIQFSFYHIDGVRVGFWECPSMVAHYDMLHDWIDEYLPLKNSGGVRWGNTSAMNFGHCLTEINQYNERMKKLAPMK